MPGFVSAIWTQGLLERGIAAAPGAVQLWKGAIAVVRKVKYYAGTLPGNSKFHISVGHTTVMATVSFWGARELAAGQVEQQAAPENTNTNNSNKKKTKMLESSSLGGDAAMAGLPRLQFDFNQDFLQQDGLLEALPDEKDGDGVSSSKNDSSLLHWAILDFQTPVYCPVNSLVIGSRLDTVDNNATGSASSCRLAFSGRLVERIDPRKRREPTAACIRPRNDAVSFLAWVTRTNEQTTGKLCVTRYLDRISSRRRQT